MPAHFADFRRFSQLEHAPVPLVVEDASELRLALAKLRRLGVSDLSAHFYNNPQDLEDHLSLSGVVYANRLALQAFGVDAPEELAEIRRTALTQRSPDKALSWLKALGCSDLAFACEVAVPRRGDGPDEAAGRHGPYTLHRMICRPSPELGPDYLSTAFIDVHDAHLTDSLTRQRAAQARAGFDVAPVPLSVWRRQNSGFVLEDANNAALRAWGAQALGRSVRQVFSGLRGSVTPEEVNRALEGALESDRQHANEDRGFMCAPMGPDTATLLGPTSHVLAQPHRSAVQTPAFSPPSQGTPRAQWSLLANASHEVRSPLSAILGLAELGLEDPRNAARHLKHIAGSARSLLNLANDLLDASRAEDGLLKTHRSVFNLPGLLAELSEECGVLARRKSLALHLELDDMLPEHVQGDSVKLRQILVNLLSNSIKFTDQGGVTLRVEPENGCIGFTVSDTGRGIAPEQQPSVFGPFTRLENVGNEPGSGLGLTIARRLAQALGGEISLRSSPGLGTAFTVLLPLPAASPPAPDSALNGSANTTGTNTDSGGSAAPRKLNVLVVEDDHLNRLVAQDVLQAMGHTVQTVPSGGQALAALPLGGIDAVLLDMQLPDMSGQEVARRIRAGEAGERAKNLTIIGLSAYTAAKGLDAPRELDAYLTKPVSRQALGDILGKAPAGFEPHRITADRIPDADITGTEYSGAQIPGMEAPQPAHARDRVPQATQELGREAVMIFTRETPPILQEMQAALRRGDAAAAAKLAHRLAGSSGVMGARTLMQVCLSLEEALLALGDGQMELRLPHIERLAAQVQQQHTHLLHLLTEQRNHLPA